MNTRFNGDPTDELSDEDVSGVELREELQDAARDEAIEAFRRHVRVHCELLAKSTEVGQLMRDVCDRIIYDEVTRAVEAQRHAIALEIDAYMRTPRFQLAIKDAIAERMTPLMVAELLSIPERIRKIVKRKGRKMSPRKLRG